LKTIAFAAALAVLLPAAPAFAADPAPAAAKPDFSTAETDIGTLLDNPATKAVLEKHVAAFVSNPQIDMARSMTLKQIQGYAGDALSDVKLAEIDADLAAIKK
jgi:hypothetical protein